MSYEYIEDRRQNLSLRRDNGDGGGVGRGHRHSAPLLPPRVEPSGGLSALPGGDRRTAQSRFQLQGLACQTAW
ncbi:MAG: hypothetical protein R2856_22130 [Caldilineaceae bacterium]